MSRPTCYRCFWPQTLCWCQRIQPMDTKTRFVLLMHPKEFKREKAGTGRLTHLCLARSEIHMGVSFENHEAVQALLHDPRRHCFLLYPGNTSLNLSVAGSVPDWASDERERTIFLLDATWACARKMLKLSPTLQRLPRLMFTPSAPSRYVIKQQPQEGCLSTLECVHELLLALSARGLDRYPDPHQLLALFQQMQDFQIQCASDPARPGYRRQPYAAPEVRTAANGLSRRRRYMGAVTRTADVPQPIESNSTSKMSVELGGIAPG